MSKTKPIKREFKGPQKGPDPGNSPLLEPPQGSSPSWGSPRTRGDDKGGYDDENISRYKNRLNRFTQIGTILHTKYHTIEGFDVFQRQHLILHQQISLQAAAEIWQHKK